MDFFRMSIISQDLNYTITEIKRKIPDDLSAIARGISSALFFSNNIRKNAIAEVVFKQDEDCLIIQFHGDTLRRVSPDERSVGMFIIKAKRYAEETPKKFGKYNEGISFEKMTFDEYISKLPDDYVVNNGVVIKKYMSNRILHILNGINIDKFKGHQISNCKISNPAYFFGVINWIIDRKMMSYK